MAKASDAASCRFGRAPFAIGNAIDIESVRKFVKV
jgi:hypothetical protein